MFEFNSKIINRDGFQFVAQDSKQEKTDDGMKTVYLYSTEDKDEIKVLKSLKFVKESK